MQLLLERKTKSDNIHKIVKKLILSLSYILKNSYNSESGWIVILDKNKDSFLWIVTGKRHLDTFKKKYMSEIFDVFENSIEKYYFNLYEFEYVKKGNCIRARKK